jgi:tetratricopeptide (TPR) repeat protein
MEPDKGKKNASKPPQAESSPDKSPHSKTGATGLSELEKVVDHPRVWLLAKLTKRFGRRRAGTVLALIFIFISAFSQWDKISPWVDPMISRAMRAPVPKIDPAKFSILVAHLESDTDRQFESLLLQTLREFDGIQIFPLDRTIRLSQRSDVEVAEKMAHDEARAYLDESGSHVLIWGLVHRIDNKSAPRLFWTTSNDAKRSKQPFVAQEFKLPDLFWGEFVDVLRLVLVSENARFLSLRGKFIVDKLNPFIVQVRGLLSKKQTNSKWDTDARNQVRLVLANALLMIGEQAGTNETLEEAVSLYGHVVEERSHDQAPFEWARAQNNLGVALLRLGEREKGTKRLKEAVSAFQDALKERTRDRFPIEWATTQNNLGSALSRLGEREGGTKYLEKAVSAFQDALKERTRNRVPLDWAATQGNLGNALFRLGEREGGTKHLNEAVSAYEEALKEQSRDRVPLNWAATQSNLGNALFRLGEREGGTKHLNEAVSAYEEALKEQSRDRVPLNWAVTQNNLGTVLREIGVRTNDGSKICQGVGSYVATWQLVSIESPYQADLSVKRIKETLIVLDKISNQTATACRHQFREILSQMKIS